MPVVPFHRLPDHARAWVFAAAHTVSADAERLILRTADAFLAQWRAHGAPLDCSREWRDGRFLCIAVDQSTVGASGCSIDGLFRSIRDLEPQLGTSLVSGGHVFWRDADGAVQAAPRAQFAALAIGGGVQAHTPVFDTTVENLGAWRRDFERPAGSSWHARWLGTAAT